MKKAGSIVNVENLKNGDLIGPTPPIVVPQQLAIVVGEVSKSYLLSGFPSPEEVILLSKAQLIAEEIPEIPPAWIPRVFSVARREFAADPKIFHLLKAWREIVNHERRKKVNDLKPKKPEPEPLSDEESAKAWREVWLSAAIKGDFVPKSILENHKITKEEIEKGKIK